MNHWIIDDRTSAIFLPRDNGDSKRHQNLNNSQDFPNHRITESLLQAITFVE
jgi:hypothetical protein